MCVPHWQPSLWGEGTLSWREVACDSFTSSMSGREVHAKPLAKVLQLGV